LIIVDEVAPGFQIVLISNHLGVIQKNIE
jgi:hypothetical protein